MAFKITYSIQNADLTELHKEFEAALSTNRSKLGQEYPSWVAGQAVKSGELLQSQNPANLKETLGSFHMLPTSHIDKTFEAAKKAQIQWGKTPWQERVKLIRKAADNISARRMEFSAWMSLEVGKNRLEALGDVEEAADLLRYYAGLMEEHKGYLREMGSLSPNEKAISILRPYGVFVVIAPFNFPIALSAGMSGGALLGGNAVILKPSQETPLCGQLLYEALRDAGLPDGLFQLVQGKGSSLGKALVAHPACDGVVFTGSKEVGMEIYHSFSKNFVKPCFLELGGKNAAFVCSSADIKKAVEGSVRSAFGLTGQKCSALSRLFVHESLKKPFIDALLERAKLVKVGNPTERDTFVGPVINEAAYKRFRTAVEETKKTGTILFGGEDIRARAPFDTGLFVQPTIVEVNSSARVFKDELFSPFLALTTFTNLEDAVRLASQSEYGLTSGIYSADPKEIDLFMHNMEAGILYANRESGATTGAWPGVQAFCGWKGSGSTGKGGCGPYYVEQFMREQSQTRVS